MYFIRVANTMINKISYKLMWLDYESGNMLFTGGGLGITVTEKIPGGYTTRAYTLEQILGLVELDLKELFKRIDPDLNKNIDFMDINNKNSIDFIMSIKRMYKERACSIVSTMGFILTIITFIISTIINVIK